MSHYFFFFGKDSRTNPNHLTWGKNFRFFFIGFKKEEQKAEKKKDEENLLGIACFRKFQTNEKVIIRFLKL